MTDAAAEHSPRPGEMKGVFERDEDYRKRCPSGCQGGYHGNRWDAHHILPVTSFAKATGIVRDNLEATGYDINQPYSLCGLPKLTAFILYFQKDRTMPYQRRKEKTITMRRWRKVRQYKKDMGKPIVFPGEFPVHNPCNWGHTDYNDEVATHLDVKVFQQIKAKAKKNEHFTPEELKTLLELARDKFWLQLQQIPQEPGGGGIVGIEANLRARYNKAKNGWWKPMCMSRSVKTAPCSPSL